MSFKSDIENLIENNLRIYRDDPDRFIADYNRELELTNEYNGRQLLELLQNADDAGSKEVEIIWDKEEANLIISNKGDAFSVNGIKSLMLANLSPKTKISYIGNKGLGFRAILNWAELIHIYSNGCKLSFSEAIAKDVFENKLNLSIANRNKLRAERELTKTTIPFPILAVPRIETDSHRSQWSTSVQIFCKREFETDISTQLQSLREEILLFLKNIQRIEIRIVGQKVSELKSEKNFLSGYESIKIKDKSWKVFTWEDLLPDEYQDKSKIERQSYNLKVAFQDDLSDNYKRLFNFFPTQLSISLPCIIHGTFELNSSRNHLNESKKNEYILKELVQLLRNCALFISKETIDWRPYKLLTPTATASDSKLIEIFYKDLEEVKNTEAIFPSISNKYLSRAKSVFYSDEFNSFFKRHFPDTLPELLIPLGDEVENIFKDDKYEHGYLVKKIDELSNSDISKSRRAELIAQLSKITPFKEEQERFSLLINDSGKVISKDDLAFTPVVRSDEKFNIPGSVKVDFMNPELYDRLIPIFESNFDKKEPKSRELQRTIKSIVNLQPYDSNNVIDKIITGTKDALKSLPTEEKQISCIKQMVIALYANFKNIENRQERLKLTVPLISKGNKIIDANDLFLSNTYPSGKLTEIIYAESLITNEYLAEVGFWGLENEEFTLVESFFLWLGVNRFSKIELSVISNRLAETDYFNFIFENGTDNPDDFTRGVLAKNTQFSKIRNFAQIQQLPIHRLILLILRDDQLRQKIESNNEHINWFFTRWRPTIVPEYSYIRYQFINSNLFTKYVLEEGGEELNRLINEDFQIDYEFLGQHGINKTEVKSLLIKLGSKESFNEISPGNIYEILKAIPDKDLTKKGKSTQTIYKLALESLANQESDYPVPEDIKFFSKKGNTEEYKLGKLVYYSDNSILPRKILNTLHMLNLPKRSGEDNVDKYFGVKSLREFKIQINESKLLYNPCDTELGRLFEFIKPYLLAYRLDSPNLKKRIIDIETKKKEARTIKQCKIHIVTQCFFTFGENDEISIDEKEFINIKEIFYFKENLLTTTEALRKDSIFCDAFAEMMCIISKVNDLKNDFRQIFKNDFQDTIHLATNDLGKDKLEEAFQLLGVPRVEIEFWKIVFEIKGKKLSEPVENTEALKSKILQNLGIALPDEYCNIDFDTFDTKESFELIKLLSINLSVSVQQILPSGLYNWHKTQFINTLKDLKYKFNHLIWINLSESLNDQPNYISILNKYTFSLIDSVENEIQKAKYDLNVDYSGIMKASIRKLFGINIDDELHQNIAIENLYGDLLNNYLVEEVDITDERIRSLLFFEGNSEIIKSYLEKNFDFKNKGGDKGDSSETKIIGSIVDASLTKNSHIILNSASGNGTGSWIHSGQSDGIKKRRGKKGELLVYNTLVDQFGIENVKWVSGNSTTPDKNDKLHYDIEYKNELGEWKYLEVKVISDNQFIISGPEKEKGMAEPDKFEMALVSDNIIYMVKDIFKFRNGETFENNSKFIPYTKDYIFSFNIKALINK